MQNNTIGIANTAHSNGIGSTPGLPVLEGSSSVATTGTFGENSAATGAHRAADLLTRVRDKWGNRLPWFFAHATAIVAGGPLEGTPLYEGVQRIKEALPVTGTELHHFYDHRLLPACQRLVSVRDHEEAKRAAYNQRVEEVNAGIAAQCAAVTKADRTALVGTDARLEEAHAEAARRVALTGGAYDPQNPTEACVLRHAPLLEEAVAALLRLPWTPADAHACMPAVVSWGTTALIGGMIGVSIGILSRLVKTADLLASTLPLTGCVLVGVAAAVAGKWAIKNSAREASQRYWLGLPASSWGPFAVLAFLVCAGVLSIDCVLEREGLMAGIRLSDLAATLSGGARGAGDGGAREFTYTLAAVILTFGYVVSSFWDGYLHGRFDACLNRIRAEREKRFHAEDAAVRAQPGVQAALEAVARVRDLLRHRGMLENRITGKEQELNAGQLVRLETLDPESLKRIQDALDQATGTQEVFDRMLADAKEAVEPSGFWQRLWRALFGARHVARRTQQETRRRLT